MNKPIRNIAIFGAGNVASYFGAVFHNCGYNISQVVARNKAEGNLLAETLNSVYRNVFDPAIQTELIILAVKDDAIAEVASALISSDIMICHCAGAVGIDLLNRIEHRSVLYPLQSIRSRPDVSSVPVLIETHIKADYPVLLDLVEKCGFNGFNADSATRLKYHLAAVFANNFSNAMLSVSERLSEKFGLNQKLLHPLIQQTYANAVNESAINSQTGPALRNDIETMAKHIDLLKQDMDLQNLYKTISAYISQHIKPSV